MPSKEYRFLRPQVVWSELYFYQKADALYQLTFRFTERFLRKGDRTVDQMVQAARSGKQNIVEGSTDGVTSTEMEVKLLNCARGSVKELCEDYSDYLRARNLPLWAPGHPRYDAMVDFCRRHNRVEDYSPFFDSWSDEEMANVAHTLCRFVDKMMSSYQRRLEKDFVAQGGIRERMTAARLGYRNDQRGQIEALLQENSALRTRIEELELLVEELKRKSNH